MTQELISGMLTQVASDPLLLGLFEELLRDEGSELYMRAPEVYGIPVNMAKTWDEVGNGLAVPCHMQVAAATRPSTCFQNQRTLLRCLACIIKAGCRSWRKVPMTDVHKTV